MNYKMNDSNFGKTPVIDQFLKAVNSTMVIITDRGLCEVETRN